MNNFFDQVLITIDYIIIDVQYEISLYYYILDSLPFKILL